MSATVKLRWLVLGLMMPAAPGCDSAEHARSDAGLGAALDAALDASADAAPDAMALPAFLGDPSAPFPDRLSETGLYADLEQRDPAPWVHGYEPSWPLWSNGLLKERYVYAPEPIDNTEPGAWRFANGTVFYKTFVEPETSRPIETRIIRRSGESWDYVAYRWNAERSDATLLPPTASAEVEVRIEGATVLHQIPSKLACRACHQSAPSPVLGFDEIQLGATLSAHGALFIADPPAEPAAIDHEDAETREVLGYLHGNCVPCHNGGGDGPNTSFDLRHDVALSNLVSVPTGSSGVEAGIRVIPGNAGDSVLIRAFARETEDPMPPFGVQARDERALRMLAAWVDGLSQ